MCRRDALTRHYVVARRGARELSPTADQSKQKLSKTKSTWCVASVQAAAVVAALERTHNEQRRAGEDGDAGGRSKRRVVRGWCRPWRRQRPQRRGKSQSWPAHFEPRYATNVRRRRPRRRCVQRRGGAPLLFVPHSPRPAISTPEPGLESSALHPRPSCAAQQCFDHSSAVVRLRRTLLRVRRMTNGQERAVR